MSHLVTRLATSRFRNAAILMRSCPVALANLSEGSRASDRRNSSPRQVFLCRCCGECDDCLQVLSSERRKVAENVVLIATFVKACADGA